MESSPAENLTSSQPATTLYDIEKPHNNDVLCGRGVTTNRHPGNEKFRALVGLNKELYVTSTKRQKMAISRSIVEAVRCMNPPGRFLEKSPDTGLYSDIGDKKAIEKTSQALRDGAASLRKQLSEDLGDPDFLSAVFDVETKDGVEGADKDKVKPLRPIKKPVPVKKGHRRVKSTPDAFTTARIKHVVKRLTKQPSDLPPISSILPTSPKSHPDSPLSAPRRPLGGSSSQFNIDEDTWIPTCFAGNSGKFTIPSPAPVQASNEPPPENNRHPFLGRSNSFERSYSHDRSTPPLAMWSSSPGRHRHPLSPSTSYPPPPPPRGPMSPGSSQLPPLSPGERRVWSPGMHYQSSPAPPAHYPHPGWRSSPNAYQQSQNGRELSVPHLSGGPGPQHPSDQPYQYTDYMAQHTSHNHYHHPLTAAAPYTHSGGMSPMRSGVPLSPVIRRYSPDPLRQNSGEFPPLTPPKEFCPPPSPSRPRPPTSELAVSEPKVTSPTVNKNEPKKEPEPIPERSGCENAYVGNVFIEISGLDETRSDSTFKPAVECVYSAGPVERDTATADMAFGNSSEQDAKLEQHLAGNVPGTSEFYMADNEEFVGADDLSLSPLPYGNNESFLEITDDLLRLPIAPVGPADTEMPSQRAL